MCESRFVTLVDFNVVVSGLSSGLELFDIYQHHDYLAIDAKLLGGEALYYIYEKCDYLFILPLIKRKVPSKFSKNEYYDLTSPYGYAGYYSSRPLSFQQLDVIIKKFGTLCKQNSYISAFVRLHPIFNNVTLGNSDLYQHIIHGETVLIDLKRGTELIRNDYSQNHKRDIRKLIKQGFKVVHNDWNRYKEFQELYTETMSYLNASSFYFFDESYFEALRKIYPNNLELVLVCNAEGRAVSGGLFFSYNKIAQYHLGGTLLDFRRVAPSKLMFDFMVDIFKENESLVYFHLGGGLGSADDELLRFKKGFSKNTVYFSTLRLITDRDKYLSFTAANQNEKMSAIDENYFPKYRA